MTKNRRYEAHYDALNDQRIVQSTAQLAACTLPQQAYGSRPIEWQRGRMPEVWAWITWRDAPATKIPAVAQAGTIASSSSNGKRSAPTQRRRVAEHSHPARDSRTGLSSSRRPPWRRAIGTGSVR